MSRQLTQHAISQQRTGAQINVGVSRTRFGNREVVFVKHQRVCADARMTGGFVNDRERAANASTLVVGDRLDLQPLRVIAIPVEQFAQVRVVQFQIGDADGCSQYRSERV